MRYDAKVSTLKYREDLDNLTMDELHGILIAYEMQNQARKVIKKWKQPSKHQKKQGTIIMCQIKIN
jgi:hypothetical protein